MDFKLKCIAVGLLTVALPQMVPAQALKNVKAPANLPPVDYKGVQFVDNKGCIFVRAGRLGEVNWVPRIDQSRKHMCSSSYVPTFAKADAPTKTAPAQPTQVADLDRGKVEYKGSVIKPVAAPDTSLVASNETKPTAAQAAREAAAKAAEETRAAELAKQEQAAEKMRADAISKKKKEEALKAAQIAEAEKAAKEIAEQDKKDKMAIAEKIKEDRAKRAAQRAADKAARAAALAEKKAAAAAARAAANADRKAKAEAAAAARAERAAERAAQREAAKQARQAALEARNAERAAKAQQAKEAREAEMAAKAEAKAAKANTKVAAAKPAPKPEPKPKAVAKPKAPAKAKVQQSAPKAVQAKPYKAGYYVDLGGISSVSKANALIARLQASGYKVDARSNGKMTVVLAGPFRTASNASVALQQMKGEGYRSAKIIKK